MNASKLAVVSDIHGTRIYRCSAATAALYLSTPGASASRRARSSDPDVALLASRTRVPKELPDGDRVVGRRRPKLRADQPNGCVLRMRAETRPVNAPGPARPHRSAGVGTNKGVGKRLDKIGQLYAVTVDHIRTRLYDFVWADTHGPADLESWRQDRPDNDHLRRLPEPRTRHRLHDHRTCRRANRQESSPVRVRHMRYVRLEAYGAFVSSTAPSSAAGIGRPSRRARSSRGRPVCSIPSP